MITPLEKTRTSCAKSSKAPERGFHSRKRSLGLGLYRTALVPGKSINRFIRRGFVDGFQPSCRLSFENPWGSTHAGLKICNRCCVEFYYGKTRGAFYDNFRDKEDVFFALFEEDIARDREKMIEEMSAASNLDERVEVLARHLAALLRDKKRILLNLEFKMFVIRHPRKRKRLSALHA
jgi:hypothetical protein